MKIQKYEDDNSISLEDKVIGTDAEDVNKTKNYSFRNIVAFLRGQGLGGNSEATIDGSETKVEAGDNVTIAGVGTDANPYIVNAATETQNLQSVLTNGTIYTKNFSTLNLFGDDEESQRIYIEMHNGIWTGVNKRLGSIYANNQNVSLRQSDGLKSGLVGVSGGVVNLVNTYQNKVLSLSLGQPVENARIEFKPPTVNTVYYVCTQHTNLFSTSNLPSGTLGDRAIVTDANLPVYLQPPTGGGSVVCTVWHNGTTWVIK